MSDALTVVRTAWPARRVRAHVDLPVWPPRRVLQVALGLLWLLDAALQFQPYMFTSAFVRETIRPAFDGDPGPVASSGLWAAGVMAQHVVLYNAIFATVQLLIALAILRPRTTKIGLAASLPWALGVWWFGEGLGGVLTGASPLTGTPGGVILYALVAVLVWPAPEGGGSVATSGPVGRGLPRLVWPALWGGIAAFLLLPGNRSADGIRALFAGEADGEPGWVAGVDRRLASLFAGNGTEVVVALAVCCVLVAASLFVPALRRTGVVLAVLLGLAVWVAQDLGGILTGAGTDPNSGPLLVLLACAYWPARTTRGEASRRALVTLSRQREPRPCRP